MAETGADFAGIAFRLGVVVHSVSFNLEHPNQSKAKRESWAYVISNISHDDLQNELDRLQARLVSMFHPS